MTHKEKLLNYYNATHIDYRVLWSGSDNRAVHFGYYDENTVKHGDALTRLNEVLAKAVKITESDRVLDSGCGYGGSGMWLAENIGSNVSGITAVPMQVAKGTRYIKERKLEKKVEILEMDYTQTTFPDRSFDVYWGLESIVHAEDRQEVINEAYRLLKTGGRIVIAEYTFRENPELTGEEKAYLKPWLDSWAMPTLLTPKEYVESLKLAGFTDIQIQDVTVNIKPSLRRLEILSILNYPIALLIAPFFFKKERLENYYGSWRQINALKKGLWTYSIITANK